MHDRNSMQSLRIFCVNRGLSNEGMCIPRGALKGPRRYEWLGGEGALLPHTPTSQEQGWGGARTAAPLWAEQAPTSWLDVGGEASMRQPPSTTPCQHSMCSHPHSLPFPVPLHDWLLNAPPLPRAP